MLEYWEPFNCVQTIVILVCKLLYTHNIHNIYTNICGNIVNNNNFNERTNTLLYKNISLTLYSRKGWCWLCVRGELETETDCYILTQSCSDHSSSTSSSWLGLLNRWSLRAASLQSASWFSCWHLVPQLTTTPTGTDPSRLWHLII